MARKNAFTLVELLVVIAIIAVLLAILLPSLASVKEMASRIKCGNSFRGIGMAMKFYGDNWDGRLPMLEYNNWPLDNQNMTQQHPFWVFRQMTMAGVSVWGAVNFGCLYKNALIQTPPTFYCPADNRWKDMMKAYAINGQWGFTKPTFPILTDPTLGDHPDPAQRPDPVAECVRVNIGYWPQSRKIIKDATRLAAIQKVGLYEVGYPDIAYKAVDLDSNRAYVSDNGGHAIGGSVVGGEKSKGQNALFGDGHVTFGKPPKSPDGTVYRIRQEMENVTVKDGISNQTNRYFFYLQP